MRRAAWRPARAEWKPLAALGRDARASGAISWRARSSRTCSTTRPLRFPPRRVFGADVGAVLVWSKTAPRLIGLFPARVERRYGVMATLTGWTHPYAPFGVPLVDRDEAEAAIGAFLDHVEADARLAEARAAAADRARRAVRGGAGARAGAAWRGVGEFRRACARAARAAQSAKTISITSRARSSRSCAASAAGCEDTGALVHMAASGPAAAVALTDFMALEAARLEGPRRRRRARSMRRPKRSCARPSTALAAKGDARIDRLIHDGHPVAASITLRSGNAAWFWKIAYDEAFARASPGVQLTLDLTDAICSPTPRCAQTDSLRHRRSSDDRSSVEERLTLCDLLIAPSAASMAQFRIARPLEALRRAADRERRKQLRDRLKG